MSLLPCEGSRPKTSHPGNLLCEAPFSGGQSQIWKEIQALSNNSVLLHVEKLRPRQGEVCSCQGLQRHLEPVHNSTLPLTDPPPLARPSLTPLLAWIRRGGGPILKASWGSGWGKRWGFISLPSFPPQHGPHIFLCHDLPAPGPWTPMVPQHLCLTLRPIMTQAHP